MCALFGSMFRPLKPVEVTLDNTDLLDHNTNKTIDFPAPVKFTKPLPEGRFAYSVPNSVHNTWIGASANTQYPTAAEVCLSFLLCYIFSFIHSFFLFSFQICIIYANVFGFYIREGRTLFF